MDVTRIVASAVETMRPAAEAKGVTLATTLAPGSISVLGDGERLQQVVANLLSNAVKFTPKEGRVTVQLERMGDLARLGVSDTGKGIVPEFLPHIFERFRQADGSSTRAEAGLGLGLAIVRHIVELHQGSVRAESAGEGKGATFTVDLPIAPAAEEEGAVDIGAAAGGAGAAPSRLDGVRVLVVDDDSDSRDLFTAILTHAGAEVTAASTVRDALASARRARPDVVVCDIAMPDDDGFALIREMGSWPIEQGGGVPALALTAYARLEDRDRALAAGFQAHLSKPVEPRDLLETVTRLARGRPEGWARPVGGDEVPRARRRSPVRRAPGGPAHRRGYGRSVKGNSLSTTWPSTESTRNRTRKAPRSSGLSPTVRRFGSSGSTRASSRSTRLPAASHTETLENFGSIASLNQSWTRSGAVVSVARRAGLDRTSEAWGQAGVARRRSPSAATASRRRRATMTAPRTARHAAPRAAPGHQPRLAGSTSTGKVRAPGPAGPATDTDTRQGPAAPSVRLAR